MSNDIGIVIASVILSAAYLGGEHFQKDKVPQNPTESIATIFHLRTECGELGQKLLTANILQSGLSHSYQSHYDITTNRCYVELNIFSADGTVDNDMLYDAQTNEILATLQTQGDRPSGTILDQNYHLKSDELPTNLPFSEVFDYIKQKMADSRQA